MSSREDRKVAIRHLELALLVTGMQARQMVRMEATDEAEREDREIRIARAQHECGALERVIGELKAGDSRQEI